MASQHPWAFSDDKPCATNAPVKAIGSFSDVPAESDGEHSYGHRLDLWRCGDNHFAIFMVWEGDLEGRGGLVDDLKFNSKTGNLSFKRASMEVNGRLKSRQVEGFLTGGKNLVSNESNLPEKILLKKTDEKLGDYLNYDDWDKACHMGHCGS